jgi:glutathione synthase/RimK-type ligase-like ATP-grasp enzyme
MRCAFLTMQDPGNFVTDYQLAIPPLERLGWSVVCVPWRDPANQWSDYDAVYLCTPWDYPAHAGEFMQVLQSIEDSGAVLVNSLALVRWNLEKTYLRDLEKQGAAIVPSSWYDGFNAQDLQRNFTLHNTNKLVLKPQLGANAADTFVLQNPVAEKLKTKLGELFRDRPFLVQPFIESIKAEGEYSLFFLGGAYSHCIQKIPKSGDFRVQEEHGAAIMAVIAPEDLIQKARDVLQLVAPEPVYARVDLVREPRRGYLLMELELIEPSLYLRTDAQAPARFAAAFDQHVTDYCANIDRTITGGH